MKQTRLYCVVFGITLLGALLLFSAYREVKLRTIDQLNARQAVLAREAARGIEGFFDHYGHLLGAFSRVNSIVNLDEQGEKLVETFLEADAGEILAVARMGADGKILYAMPSLTDEVKGNLFGRELAENLMRTRSPIVTDVLVAGEGAGSVALHVPVFREGVFDGSVAVLIPFDHLARRYVGEIKLGEDGYAWLISRKGIELYCYVPGHVGKSVYETCKDFPTVLSMADQMVRGESGKTTYVYDRIRGEVVESVIKHAVYLPVKLPGNHWSIVVATPESEVIDIIEGFRNKWFLVIGMMLLVAILCSYCLGRALIIVRHEADRKAMEDALRAALEQATDEKCRTESIIASLSDGVTILDKDMKIIFQNDVAVKDIGDHSGTYCYMAFHGRDSVCEECPILLCFEDGCVHRIEKTRKSGKNTVQVEVAASVIRNASGEITGAVEIARDITGRKQAEEALRTSEARYRTLFENATDAILLLSDNTFIDCNENALKFYGCGREELLGKGPHDFSPPYQPNGRDSREESTRILAGALAGKPQSFEWRHHRCDGTLFDAEIVTSRIEMGEETLIMEIARDISERKRSEEALHESARFLQGLIDALPVPIFYKDREGRYLGCNGSYERFIRRNREGIIGKSIFDFSSREFALVCHEKDLELFRDKKVQIYESFVHDADGVIRSVVFHKAPFEKADGSLGGLIGVVMDITERKDADASLRDSEQRLAHIIQGSPIPTFVIGKDHRVIYWNKALEEMSRLGADAMIGTSGHWRPFYSSERPCLVDLLVDDKQDAISFWYGGTCDKSNLLEGAYEGTDYFAGVGGEGKWLRFTAAAIRDFRGTVVGAIETLEDITDRKRAEEALIKANRQLNDIVEFLPDATFVVDADERIIAWNRAIEEMTGLSKTEMIGKAGHAWIAACYEDRLPYLLDLKDKMDQDVEPGAGAAPRKAGILSAETYLPSLYGGEGGYVLATAAPLLDTDGNSMGGIESIRDITEQRFAEEALKESRQQLSDIIDFLPDATFVIDKAGIVIAWNRAMEEMTGVLAEEMLGKGDYQYALPFYGERRPILIDFVLNPRLEMESYYVASKTTENVITGECFTPVLGGVGAYIFGKASVLFDSKGKVAGAIESIRDITERRCMEKALAEAEAKYRGIFENAVTGIYQATPDGRFLSLNRALAGILGYDTPDELLISEDGTLKRLYADPGRHAELLALVEGREMVQNFEARFYKKDRSIAWIALNVRAVRDASGRIIQLEGTAQDITEGKLLESQLNQARKMEAIGTLAGGIAHDFNNILTPIIGYAELTQQEVPKGSRLYRNMEQILLSGNRARDLVQQILTFSRRTEKERKPVQVSLLVKETLKLLRSSLPSTIEIVQCLAENAMDGTVMADPIQIHQVLMNLCTNAAHAMRGRGGVLTIALRNEDLGGEGGNCPAGVEPGAYLRLTVADTGDGINESVRQRMFEPYFTTKEASEGTGLGLALVYGIVKSLSGTIEVVSSEEKGTTFDVYFPRAETLPAPSFDQPGTLPTGEGVILVVDDEKSVVDLLKEMLEGLGYEVAPSYSSPDALQAFRMDPGRFDMVITDLTMPHMTGVDLAREIVGIRRDLPIILCTGFSETIDRDRLPLPEIRGFLMKPVAMHDLAVTVKRVLLEKQAVA